MRIFQIFITFLGLLITVAFTIEPITFTIERLKIFGTMLSRGNIEHFYIEYLLSNIMWPEVWLFLGIGAFFLLCGVFSARLTYFWIPLIIIGSISILSFSGVFLRVYQIEYMLPGFFSILDEVLDAIKFLLPGVALIIGGIILHKRYKTINIQ
jgi:hypothetical protein